MSRSDMVTTELRFVGKTTRHAGNYDMRKKRLMQIVNTDAKKFHIDIQISEWRAGQILDAFHNFSPKIRQVFHTEVVQALRDNERTLVNPFGRRRQFFGRFDDELERKHTLRFLNQQLQTTLSAPSWTSVRKLQMMCAFGVSLQTLPASALRLMMP